MHLMMRTLVYALVVTTVMLVVLTQQYQIKQVHVITRHGDRVPVHSIPVEPVTWYCKLPNDVLASPIQQVLEQDTNQLFVKYIKPHQGLLAGMIIYRIV
jgi:hypothetical protein